MEALKSKLRATWIAGDFGEIAKAMTAGANEFIDRLDLKNGVQILDVACGTGSTAIPAAKAGAVVTGIDIAPNLIAQARAAARAANVSPIFEVGDAEAMPYADSSFDAVITMFGAMFAPRPDVVAAELKRVCRPGGLIAMANWTPQGFIGQMFKTTAKHISPPVGMPSPLLWGDEESVRRRLGDGVSSLLLVPKKLEFVFPFGPVEVVEHFRKFYGPTNKAFDTLGAADNVALRRDLEQLWTDNNQATDGTTRVASEYLEIKAIKAR